MPSFSDNAVHDRIAQFLHHAIRFVSAHPLLSLGKTLAELPEFLEHVRAPLRFFRGPQHAKVVNGNDRCGWDAMLLDYADFFVLADFSEHRSKAVLELTGTDRLFITLLTRSLYDFLDNILRASLCDSGEFLQLTRDAVLSAVIDNLSR